MVWPTLGSRKAKEQNRTCLTLFIFEANKCSQSVNGPFVYGGLTVFRAGTLPISFFSDSVKIMRFYDFAQTPVSWTLVQILLRCLIKWIFGDLFTTCTPVFTLASAVAKHSTQHYQRYTRACVTWNGPCGTLMTSVSSVGGMPCSFARLIYTPQERPPSQPPRLVAARIRLMTSRCRGPSRSWTSPEKRRKQCLWNFLNIFTKIRFIITPNSSLDSAWIAVQESETLVTVRNQLSRIFDTEHGGTLSPMNKRLKFFRMHNRTVNQSVSVYIAFFWDTVTLWEIICVNLCYSIQDYRPMSIEKIPGICVSLMTHFRPL